MSIFEKMFKLSQNKTTVRTELIAGLTTFLTMAYIIFVNADIIGIAISADSVAANEGIALDPAVAKSALLAITAIVSALASIMMGLWANLPVAQAPGMGLNSFFTFTIVLNMGYSWRVALGMVFVSGVIFVILTIAKIRELIVRSIPTALRSAISVGIGIFITAIGLINLGLIRFTAIGGINFGETMTADLPEVSETGSYLFGQGHVLPMLADINLEILLGLIGLFIMAVLLAKKVKGAILIGIIGTTILGLIFGKVNLPPTFISMPQHVGKVALKLDILGALKLSAIGAILSFAFVDLFDSLGTLLAVTTEAKLVDEKGRVKNLNKALESDAVATVFGALFGTSTTTSYIESASGVAEGGRTGLTSVFVGLFFILAIFFTPVFAIVPSFATAPALIIVGLFMMASIKKINFRDIGEGFPAFLTIVLMPLSYSISVGIGFGFLGYVLINLLTGNWKRVNITLVIITLIFVITTLVHVI